MQPTARLMTKPTSMYFRASWVILFRVAGLLVAPGAAYAADTSPRAAKFTRDQAPLERQAQTLRSDSVGESVTVA